MIDLILSSFAHQIPHIPHVTKWWSGQITEINAGQMTLDLFVSMSQHTVQKKEEKKTSFVKLTDSRKDTYKGTLKWCLWNCVIVDIVVLSLDSKTRFRSKTWRLLGMAGAGTCFQYCGKGYCPWLQFSMVTGSRSLS